MTCKTTFFAICAFVLTLAAILCTLMLWYGLGPALRSESAPPDKPVPSKTPILSSQMYTYVGGPIVIHSSNITRPRREVKAGSVTAPGEPTQCSKGRHYTFGLQICIPSKTVTTITIPISSLKGWKDTKDGIVYSNDYWYMTNDIQSQGWDTLVADQENKWTPTQAKTEWAARQAELLTMAKAGNDLMITVNNIKQNLTHNGEGCWMFLLRAYAEGTDPMYRLILCEIVPKQGVDTKPVLSPILHGRGIKVTATENLTKEQVFNVATGVSEFGNNWLTIVEQATKHVNQDCIACMGPRPLLRMVPTPPELSVKCVENILTKTVPDEECAEWDAVYPLTRPEKQKPLFDILLPTGNYTCLGRSNSASNSFGSINGELCANNLTTNEPLLKMRSDIYWYCGGKVLRGNLPAEFTGLCALVSLIIPVDVMALEPGALDALLDSRHNGDRVKREYKGRWGDNDPTYIDAIGVPRGVPDEYKLVNQIATGFENLPFIVSAFPITPNKNVDRINYIHYNVQKLGNYTQEGFEAVHEQLSATSLFSFQTRIAVDMLLASRGGVCSVIEEGGANCCVVIPNNTAADGSLTRAIGSLRALNRRLKEQSGVNTSFWDDWLGVFGRYKALVSSALVSIAVFVAILTLCGCCCIPCLRSLINRLITTALTPEPEEKGVPEYLLEDGEDRDPEGALQIMFQESETSQV